MSLNSKNVFRLSAGLLAIAAIFLCISYVTPGTGFRGTQQGSGQYSLISELDGEKHFFQGPVYFEMAQQNSGVDEQPVFKLHFINAEVKSGNGFGFLIPLGKNQEEINADRYNVVKESGVPGSQQETVFGYADVLSEGSALYFTETGSISISRVEDQEVVGEMNMWLKSANGSRMRVRGSFTAIPLKQTASF